MLQTATPLYDDLIPGGSHWSFIMRRGHVLRLIDETGGANVGMLMYNPENPLERYNMPDTLKNQHTFLLTKGHVLLSDMGRVFASIIRDDLGWHDTVAGTFTISVLGSVDSFTPILNSGQSAILGVGRSVEKPVVRAGEVVVRQMMTLSLTVDHQVIDGAVAAEFMRRLKQIVERPAALFK